MANATVTKGSTIEVSSDEPGFHGAWYVATIIDEVEPSNKKNKTVKKTRYLVKYHTLLNEDGASEPLTEVVDPSFVRPSPPRNIRRNNGGNATEADVAAEEEDGDGGVDFEVCDVVDAFHRDGWWTGVVRSVIADGEMKKYVVSFENPPEEFEFERCKLRFHVDWIDLRWMTPSKKTPEQELGDKNASDDAASGLTAPSKRARITDAVNRTVGPPTSAKRNTRSRKRSESNSPADSSVTSSRNKRVVKLVEDGSRGKKLQSAAGVGNIRDANMDPLARLVGPLVPMGLGGKGDTKVNASVSETSGSDIHQDSTHVEQEIIITQTRKSENNKSHQKRKRGSRLKLIKKPIGLLEDGHGVTTDIDEQPLSVWLQGMYPVSVLKRRSCFSPRDRHGNSPNQAIVTSAGIITGYQKDWPFIKRSPVWSTIESLELYLTTPQKPHFSPLKKSNEDYREGLAIAHMVTFENLVQRLSDLRPNDPVDTINNSLETLSDLESHGFDVGPIRARLNKLLSLKTKVCHHEDTRKEVEKKIEKCNQAKLLVEKEMDQLKVKMQELKEKTVQTATMMKVKEGEIRELQSNLHLVTNQINDLELAFEKLAATPL